MENVKKFREIGSFHFTSFLANFFSWNQLPEM